MPPRLRGRKRRNGFASATSTTPVDRRDGLADQRLGAPRQLSDPYRNGYKYYGHQRDVERQ